MTSLRSVIALPLPLDAVPNVPATTPPEILWVATAQLRVDDRYQRELSRRSIELIYRIVKDFDWRRFKPPVVVRSAEENGMFDILDGQHTAIAAATHGGIAKIPVLVVDAARIEDRAKAFLGHNRDRVTMQAVQLFFAALAAGDEDALTVKQVCDRAGAKILKLPPQRGVFQPGETIAVSTLKGICGRGAMKGRIVVETCVRARLAPITADALRAVDTLLNGSDYAGEIEPDNLVTSLMRRHELEPKISELAMAKKIPRWRAMVIVLYQNTRKARRAA